MSSSEEVAYPILRKHDVDYVLVIFGGLIGYSGDDINKFLWMVRISQGVWPDEIQETNYFTPNGEYRVDDRATTTMKESLMYKMSYYRFVPVFSLFAICWSSWSFRFSDLFGGGQATDRVRQQTMPQVGPTLDYLGMWSVLDFTSTLTYCYVDEAFTSENWIVSSIRFLVIRVSYYLSFPILIIGPNISSQERRPTWTRHEKCQLLRPWQETEAK